MSFAETFERTTQVSEFVSRKFPISVLLGLPKSEMARLNRRDHQVADGGQILSALRLRRSLRPRGIGMRTRQCDTDDGCRNNRKNGKGDGTILGRRFHKRTFERC